MFVSPMLLQKADAPFEDENWITELKLDGIRLLLSKFDGKVKLYTRHHNEVTSKFPELHSISIPDGTILDGELIVPGEKGKPDFEAMMERFQSTKSQHQIQFCVFDIIYYEGQVVNLALYERKQLLERLIPDSDVLCTSKWIYGNAGAYFDLVKEQSLEGIVQKRADSKYQINKRSDDWRKVIHYQYTDAFILGLRKDKFGLLLGVGEPSRLRPVGVMEFVTNQERKRFYSMYKEFVTGEDKTFIYLQPQLRCEIKFRNWTKSGNLRIPSLVRFLA
ncbi:ATP-dependent DNA ligase [Metabacillus sp. SLBN-84]